MISPPERDDPARPEPPTRVRFLVLGGLCLAASIAYLCRNSLGVAESTIRAELGLSQVAMSWVMSSFFLVYAFGQIPSGWLVSRFGSRTAITACSLGWSLATALMSFAAGAPLLILSRLGNGCAQAGLFPACTATIGVWFPETRRATSNGVLSSAMSIGGAVGVAITGVLLVHIGWQLTFLGYAGLGIVFAMAFYFGFRNLPSEHRWVNLAEQRMIGGVGANPIGHIPTDWLGIFSSLATWWICGQQLCRAAGEIFFSTWFATYLQQTRGVSVEQSGLLNSLPLLGIVTGALLGGGVSDFVLMRTGSKRLARSGVASVSLACCALFVFGAYFIADPFWAVVTISLGMFCAAIGGPCAYTVTIDMGGRHTPVLFATMNMVGNLGAFAFIRVVPEITERLNWDAVLGLFGMLYAAAAAFWLLINPQQSVLDSALIRTRSH